MVLQALEGLSDRDVAGQVRTNIAWKVAAGLAFRDHGGIRDLVLPAPAHPAARTPDSPERIFDAVRSVIDATGVLTGRRRRALDSTLLDDAVATEGTEEVSTPSPQPLTRLTSRPSPSIPTPMPNSGHPVRR